MAERDNKKTQGGNGIGILIFALTCMTLILMDISLNLLSELLRI